MRILQSTDRFHVLAISYDEVKLYEGNRDAVQQTELSPAVPQTIQAALGDELSEPHRTVASYGGTGGPASMHHGHGDKSDEVKGDRERFFRAVDAAIWRQHSEPSCLPLVLAGLPEHHHAFRKLSNNQHLLPEGIDKHPDSMAPGELAKLAWKVLEPRYLARLSGLVEQFGTAHAQGKGSSDPDDVARAATAGQVATLLLEAGRQMPGRIDPDSGGIVSAELCDPAVDDLLDDIGELVLRTGGELVIVPADRMPVNTGLAAIYRY
jgi:hypothetical protein